MTKEKRLGRGLEALLGQLPNRSEPTASVASPRPAAAPLSYSEPSKVGPTTPGITSAGVSSSFFEATGVPAAAFSSEPGAAAPPRRSEMSILDAAPATVAPVGMQKISIHLIDGNPDQPRQDFDPGELKTLSESLVEHGLLQPVVVRKLGVRYQLIAGERRLRAAVEAGWTEVPVNIVEADDRQTAELAIIENLQRKDLNPLEKAACFQRYLDEYGCTQEELAGRLKLDRSTIANFIRLIELPGAVQDCLRKGEITQGHARALLPLGDEREQIQFCDRIKKEGLNVRQTESLVQETIAAADADPLAVVDEEGGTKKVARRQNQHLANLEQELRRALGLKKVQIACNAKGRGKIVVHFRDNDEFERIFDRLCVDDAQNFRSQAG